MSRQAQTSGGRREQSSGSGFSLSSLASGLQKVGSYAQQAWDFAQAGIKGYQQAQQFAASLGIGGRPSAGQGPPPAAPAAMGAPAEPVQPAPPAFAPPSAFAPPPGLAAPAGPAPTYDTGAMAQPQLPSLPAGADQLAALLQALQQRQIPQLPGAAPSSAFAASAPSPAPAAPQQPNALALLGTILTNPQLQQALHSGMARNIHLPVPSAAAPGQARSVPIPLNAVLSAVLSLAGHSMSELAEAGEADSSDAPLYVLGDDGYMLVDPGDPDQRDALIAYLFRLNAAARELGWDPQTDGYDPGGFSQ